MRLLKSRRLCASNICEYMFSKNILRASACNTLITRTKSSKTLAWSLNEVSDYIMMCTTSFDLAHPLSKLCCEMVFCDTEVFKHCFNDTEAYVCTWVGTPGGRNANRRRNLVNTIQLKPYDSNPRAVRERSRDWELKAACGPIWLERGILCGHHFVENLVIIPIRTPTCTEGTVVPEAMSPCETIQRVPQTQACEIQGCT
jgi:hypothetical protein